MNDDGYVSAPRPTAGFTDEWSEAAELLGARDRLREQQPWRAHAACIGADVNLFFPTTTQQAAEARRICSTCSVRVPCGRYGTQKEDFGIWGGINCSADKYGRRSAA